ncbi:hypothetical protein KPL74_03450 [Bacillus sp. NP157]|nr:hypothetical protein KPL74_03450 [Bacillus sp. NP157]
MAIAEPIGAIRLRADAINDSRSLEPAAKARELSSLYARDVRPLQHGLADRASPELHALFYLAQLTLFYARFGGEVSAADAFSASRDDYAELERRHAVTRDETGQVYDGLVSERDFVAANAFRARHPEAKLDPLPPISVSPSFRRDRPAVFSLGSDGRTLDLHNVSLDHEAQVVVVAQCHFARDAARDIANDPELAEAFAKGHAVWVEDTTAPLSAGELAEWNASFPRQPLAIVYDGAAWQGVDFASSPTFHFFKAGKLAARQVGFSRNEAFRSELKASLRALGAMD